MPLIAIMSRTSKSKAWPLRRFYSGLHEGARDLREAPTCTTQTLMRFVKCSQNGLIGPRQPHQRPWQALCWPWRGAASPAPR